VGLRRRSLFLFGRGHDWAADSALEPAALDQKPSSAFIASTMRPAATLANIASANFCSDLLANGAMRRPSGKRHTQVID
jgi:hypothetical protein